MYSNLFLILSPVKLPEANLKAISKGSYNIEELEENFEYVKKEAEQMGCYEVTLNVWSGNTSAEKFYEKMGMKTKERQMEYIL